MPLVHISLRSGKSDVYRQAIFDGVYHAMRDALETPEDNQFMAITEHTSANFRFGGSYLDIARSEDLVFIQITLNNTRSSAQKKALFQRIAELLGDKPQIRSEDVFINLIEVEKENWSLGNGIAQYA
ncbi:4-oxalocrotonate tautomerase [Pseudovibrio sp. Ad46]|uniref:tautomerase family protein n=1 Tax=Pseudovibrio sp. Ad46 TaxID=989432 RepID=UPI0007AE4F91|nr:tautomerase family protein [Pseudovibrio sp. Ad46]KZK77583.1 4-oxalocrotonate tautomerase [Pseudovibrio sp. Ad46]